MMVQRAAMLPSAAPIAHTYRARNICIIILIFAGSGLTTLVRFEGGVSIWGHPRGCGPTCTRHAHFGLGG